MVNPGMTEAALHVQKGPARPSRVLLREDLLLIGRSEDCALILLDDTASRHHASVERTEDGFRLKDLGSSNGTFVNGDMNPDRLLIEGDEIRIGSVHLQFSLKAGRKTIIVEEKEESPTTLRVETSIPGPTFDPTEGDDDDGLLRRLKTLYRVNTALSRCLDTNELLLEVFRSLTEVLPFERGAVWYSKGGQTRPLIYYQREDENHRPFQVSSTLLQRVLVSKEGVLVRDVLEDEKLRDRRSVLLGSTLSIAAVPLLVEGNCMGVLYIDSTLVDSFSPEDLELLLGLACPTGLAIRNAETFTRKDQEAHRLRQELTTHHRAIGDSPEFKEALSLTEKVGPTDTTVLLLGETGTGKEILARTIHNLSTRREGPFVPVNCAAISPSLLESELFGHVSGAFTGAHRDAPGQFRLADGGTLFLDEVGEMPPELQSKLLRVLEEREVRPVGADRTVAIDIRILAATNRDLQGDIETGGFRADLYYRLGVMQINIPPLRERTGDILLLARSFLDALRGGLGKHPSGFSSEAAEILERYPWPGNVRELRNVVERASVLAAGEQIKPRDLPDDVRRSIQGAGGGRFDDPAGDEPIFSLKEAEKIAIERALQKTGGRKGEAAKLLGTSWPTLTKKIREYGLD